MRVAVLFNAPVLTPDHPDFASEADVVEVASVVVEAMRAAGHDAWPVAAAPPVESLVRTLAEPRPDVVFNLIEGFAGSSGGEAHVTALLELVGLPYTGCPPEAQGLCRHKARAKWLLAGARVATESSCLVEPGESAPDWRLPWPVMVKPASEDASLGIDQGSVASTPEDLAAAIGRLREAYRGTILVEQYLPGREFNVGVLELAGEARALPIAEIVYQARSGAWPILTYAAKWDVGSEEDRTSVPHCPAEIDEDLAGLLASKAVRAFHATGCRDYARVDFRLQAGGYPMVLEVNPNPDIGPSAGWARALRASGRDYDATLVALAEQARRRGGHG